jgi:tRNA (Thr-GGU) A37 N-methylase
VKLIEVDQNILYVENLDILDGTPLLDLKPYIPEFDSPIEIRLGWLESVIREARTQRSDKRFK